MTRVNIGKQHPDAYQHLIQLSGAAEKTAHEAGLEQGLIELIRLRVSQLNGCAFCCRMHSNDALKAGETTDRLAVLSAWWESQYFSNTEQAAIGLAEEITRLSVPARESEDSGALTPEQVSAVSWLAIVMNAWNRVAIHSGYPVAP